LLHTWTFSKNINNLIDKSFVSLLCVCKNNLHNQAMTSRSGRSPAVIPRILAPAQIVSKDIARFHPLTKPMENGGSSPPEQHRQPLNGCISNWHKGTGNSEGVQTSTDRD
jgi:hypothetical protein